MMTKSLRIKQAIQLSLFLVLSVALIACETVGYYSQAARGQIEILSSRRSIPSIINDSDTASELKVRLQFVEQLRDFAGTELGLPAKESFSSFVDLERDHVVWNVFAAPEFSTSPVNWCYPIAGCVSYRGYFSEAGALKFADQLIADGFDVYTGGVDAYSTLGWFDDPLLSTVIDRVDYQLAGLIFHELAHLIVYVEGDTRFNESFATAVEREGVKRWLESISSEQTIEEAERSIQRQEEFVRLVMDFQTRFKVLYEQTIDEPAMREQKIKLQADMRSSYEELKISWQGYAGYDGWFARPLNNAQLSTVSSYNDYVPYFRSQLDKMGGNFEAFYLHVIELANMPRAERTALIEAELDG